jgi:amidase
MEGVWQVSAALDTAGGMAKSTRDLATLSDLLLQQANPSRPSLANAMQENWNGISVGFVDIELWRLPQEARGNVPGYDEQSVSLPGKSNIAIHEEMHALILIRPMITTTRSGCFKPRMRV